MKKQTALFFIASLVAIVAIVAWVAFGVTGNWYVAGVALLGNLGQFYFS